MLPVLHSVSYSGSWGQHFLSVEAFVEKAAELGFEGVMLMAKRPHLSVLDWNASAVSALRKRIEQLGLGVTCLAGYTNFTADLEHPDIPNREYQIEHVTSLARLAQDLGGSLVRIFTGYENSVSTSGAQWKIVVDAIRECAQRAAEFGVTVGVQNHHDIACGFESQKDLIDEIAHPNCRAIFDAWAPALHGADLPAAARLLAPLTVHTTFANYQKRPRYRYNPSLVNYEPQTPYLQAVPMEEGFIDYLPFLLAMVEGGYNGAVAYEMCSPIRGGGSLQNLDCYAKQFLSYMQGV